RHVALAPQLVAGDDVVAERMAVIEHAAAEPMRDYRGLEVLGQRTYLRGSVERAAADEDQRALGLGEKRDGLLERSAVERRHWLEGCVVSDREGSRADLGRGGQDVGRDLEADRTRTARGELLEGGSDLGADLGWCGDALCPLGEVPDDAELV